MQKYFISNSEEETSRIANKLALVAKKGDVFALFGTLGMGKSVLARSFIQSFIGEKEVPSPTFTLLQTYETTNFDIYHYDLYRLKSEEEVFELGIEDAFYSGVSLIEWPEKMGGYLPRNIFKVEITPFSEGRCIKISAKDSAKQKRLEELV